MNSDLFRRFLGPSLLDGVLLLLFMLAANGAAVALEHPDGILRSGIESAILRRALMGLFMGVTAVLLIRSPMGRRSGAHFNPAVTLAFWRLGHVPGGAAALYIAAQILGAVLGSGLAYLVFGDRLANPGVRFVATLPGRSGAATALLVEAAMAAGLLLGVLALAAHPKRMGLAPLYAGTLVALYILAFGPVTGMSINPARSFGSNLLAGALDVMWVYVLGPVLGMQWAAGRHQGGRRRAACAKLLHEARDPCPFCNTGASRALDRPAVAA
jgi:aquaporin Z